MYRGKRPVDDPMLAGVRQDTRKHTKHCLRPSKAIVEEYLSDPTVSAWRKFKSSYLALLRERHEAGSTSFEQLAELAMVGDVYLGCSCPTTTNPDVNHCHTVLALQFMQQHYSAIEVVLPPAQK